MKGNLIYVVLAVVAIVLIGITIGLQVMILSGAQPIFRSSQPSAEQPGGSDATEERADPVAMAVTQPTDTPRVVVLDPTATPRVIFVTATPPPAPLVPEPPTPDLAAPTATPTLAASSTPAAPPTIAPATATPTVVEPRSDLVLGVVDRGAGCLFASDAAAQILTGHLDLAVSTLPFASMEDLFTALAARDVDATLCYMDPQDRALIRGENRDLYGYYAAQIGSSFWDTDAQKFQVWMNVEARTELRQGENRCAFHFLETFTIAEPDAAAQGVQSWLDAHAADIAVWTDCSQL